VFPCDLSDAPLLPLNPTISCRFKIQYGLTFLVPAYLGCPEKEAIKQMFVCDTSDSAYSRTATSDVEMSQFFVDVEAPAPALPPRARRSTSVPYWKDPPPSPPVEVRVGSLVFSDSSVCKFFGRSNETIGDPTAAKSHSERSVFYADHCQDAATYTNQSVVSCTSFSGSGNVDQCTQTDDYVLGSLAESSPTSRSVPAQSGFYAPQTVVDHAGLFQSGIDSTMPGHLLSDDSGRVSGVNCDGLSALSYSSSMPSNNASPHSEGTQCVGLCKRFDTNAWHVEQEKLKQMSLDLPNELDTKDDQLPDLSSSNMLSVAALRLYDSIYSGQSASTKHRATPARSLSSVWMRNQNPDAVQTTDLLASSVHVDKARRGPCPAVHKAFEAEHHTRASDAYSCNVSEPTVGNSQSFLSTFMPESQPAQKMSQSEIVDEKYNYVGRRSGSGVPETYIPTNDINVRLAADNSGQLGFSERGDAYVADTSYVDNYRWRATATPSHVLYSAGLQTSADDAVLARRPSIKELKVRFEAETSSDTNVREAAQIPRASFTAGQHCQMELSSLAKTGNRSFRGRTGSESGQIDWQQARADTGQTSIVASASSRVDSSSKNLAPKGRFVTRSSVATSALLPNSADIGQADYKQFERLVDRRKVFEAADTQPVA